MRALRLANGQTIAEHSAGRWVLAPDDVFVDVEIDGERVTLTRDDDPEFVAVETTIVAEEGFRKPPVGRSAGKATVGTSAGKPGRSEDAKRWARLNAFEDHIAPHLAPVEQSVWHHLFRHCRDGTTKSSVRDMAANRGIDFKTASKALAHLIAVGLVWYVFKSAHKGERSVFGMHLQPEECRSACMEVDAPRRARQKRRRPPPVRDRASRRRTTRKPR